MKQSQLLAKTSKTSQADAKSINHDLLTRAGFVDQHMAGVYSYLPLGWKVLDNISNIIREEMNALGGQEIFLPALHAKENWEKTKRWDKVDILFKLESQTGSKYALGPTHEEVIVPLAQRFVSSYRDLPASWYQIQTKFRDELRAKAGLLRGREFLMKDLYSFHTNVEDFKEYYEKSKQAYHKVFSRCGLEAIMAQASGGDFTDDFSHEFQVATPNGEDTIYSCECGFAQNKEIAHVKTGDICPDCKKGTIEENKTIEVGNIFDLGTKFSKDFNLKYADESGKEQLVLIGCYGIGVSRLMGAIVEVHNDEHGMLWPKEVAPAEFHLVTLGKDEDVFKKSQVVYDTLLEKGKTVLWDDRHDLSAGEKLGDADLIGLPLRLVVSPKTGDKIESKGRTSKDIKLISISEL
jgi:prolyl-tRNA synthetase